jgi:hypothetical protein
MTDRERLMELFKGAENKVAEALTRPLELEEWLGIYADHLLANGVIVPPCKVGDKVFYIDTCETAEDFGKKFVSFSKVKRVSVDNECAFLADHTIVRWRGVFLTEEEAEAELQKGDEGRWLNI